MATDPPLGGDPTVEYPVLVSWITKTAPYVTGAVVVESLGKYRAVLAALEPLDVHVGTLAFRWESDFDGN